jgi:hypothetical protein
MHYVIAQSIVFQRDNEIWMSDNTGKDQRLICEGRGPDISPDGKSIAFTTNKGLCYFDIESGKTHVFKSTEGNTILDPKWSPDNKLIAFVCPQRPGFWRLNVVDLENNHSILTEGGNIEDLWSPTWDQKGKYILCHDGFNLFKIDLYGEIIDKIPLPSIVLTYDSVGFSSDSKFSLSIDGAYLLFDAYVDNEHIKDLPEPPIAIFIHNLSKGETTRVTPSGICALRPCWASKNVIIFEGFSEDDIKVHQGNFEHDTAVEINRGIYSIDIDGENLKKLINNGSEPSFSGETASYVMN